MTPSEWKEIERLYEASINLAPEQRARFLAESCTDDDVRREIESLLPNVKNCRASEQRGVNVAAEIIPRNERGTLVGVGAPYRPC
jgi:hypothetical protein